MTGSKRKIVQIAILIGVLLLGGYAIGKTLFSSDGTPQVGGKPPEFELAAMDGSVQKLSDYKGRPLVINFWGTFCPPCVKEMPEFQRQYVKWKGQGLEILAINLSEDDITVTNFLKRFNLDYQILRDRDRQTEKAYGVRQYPTTFFVKPNGEIKEIFIGGMTEAAIDERITELFRN